MKSFILKLDMQTILKITLTLSLIGLFSCKTEFYEAPIASNPDAGSLDASVYVAIGTSITSGFADNALYKEGQNYAYPNLIAQK